VKPEAHAAERRREGIDPGAYSKAILNILGDFGEEKERLQDTQRAVLNILDDFGHEEGQLRETQRAVLNILDDAEAEKARLQETQRAVLNILEDVDVERSERAHAEAQVRALNEDLEARVTQRTAALEAANKELEAFSYSVSHDLRAPLRAIDGFSQALLEDYAGKLDGEGQDALHRVRDASQRMGHMIDDLLQLARSTRGELEIGTVDLGAIAGRVAARLRDAEPGRRVRFSVAPDLVARGDARLLEGALENLIGNAWKFTAKKAEAVIDFGAERGDGEMIFHLRDNGAGFDPAFADKLFAPFHRLHRWTEFAGNGVGLATVKRVIARLGGRVWAEGRPDHGATFYFTLPRAAGIKEQQHG
jgi:light-regulated signal transduction histidine kinase (bacteriophytochrome)